MDNNAPITEVDKNNVYNSLADALIKGLENNSLTVEESQLSSQYILSGLETISTKEQLISFLEDISTRWPAYKETFIMVKEQELNQKDTQQIKEVQKELQTVTQ